MSVDQVSPWMETLLREAGIRKSLIVHGNVSDICLHASQRTYQPVLETMIDLLKSMGFDEVVVWDRFSGVQNISEDRLSLLRRSAMDVDSAESQEGEEYQVGDDMTESSSTTRQGREQNPDDFFSIVYHSMLQHHRNRSVFIIDWSHYLFGNANSLSEHERSWLVILSKAIRNSRDSLDTEDIAQPSNLLVLFANSLANIPPSYYHKNPMVKQIAIPLPARKEREAFLRDNLSRFQLSKSISPNEPVFADCVDMLDGFTLRDIQQMIKLSRQTQDHLSFEKLVNLYKYGEKNSPWEELSHDKLSRIEEALRERVKGQDEAIKKVSSVIIRAYTGLSGLQHSTKQKKTKGALFFTGPTGVGKTELAKALAEFLFGDEAACIRFDMSEYNHEHSDQRLVGAPPGYTGYEEGGQLTNAVAEKPFSVLLFDEIEKAHPRILDKFLQILEDGRLTDGRGETVHFSETVIIFTSNLGAAQIKVSENREVIRDQFIEQVRSHFIHVLKRPELLNRIGNNIVVFNHITAPEIMTQITMTKLLPLRNRIREKYKMDIYFEDSEKSVAAIVAKVDKADGGRGILNVIEPAIMDELARFIFENYKILSPGKAIKIVQAGNTAAFDFELE